MGTLLKYIFLISFLLFKVQVIIFSQNNNLLFNRISSEQGLNSNFIISIEQDSAGFMWFGNEQGLIRYDGYQFINFKPVANNNNTLKTAFITMVKADLNGNIWATSQNGVSKYIAVDNRFINYFFNANDTSKQFSSNFYSIDFDNDGDVWLTSSNGLVIFNPKTNKFKHVLYGSKDSLIFYGIAKVFRSSQNDFWLGCLNGKLIKYNKQKGITESIQLKTFNSDKKSNAFFSIKSICEDKKGILWLSGIYGIVKYNPKDKSISYIRPYDSLNINIYNSLNCVIDKNENLWVATSIGLIKYNTNNQKHTNFFYNPCNPRGLPAIEVQSLKISSDNVLWVGTYQGGVCNLNLKTNNFINYSYIPNEKNSISQNSIFSIFNDNNSNIWISSFNGILEKINRNKQTVSKYNMFPNIEKRGNSTCACKIVKDKKGRLWIASWHVWLTLFDPKTEKKIHFRKFENKPNSLGVWSMRDLTIDNNGNLWIASIDNGLDFLDLTKYPNPTQETAIFKHYNTSSTKKLPHNNLQSLAIANTTLWIGTYNGGLIKCNTLDTTFTVLKKQENNANSPSDNTIFYIHKTELNDSIIWLGTANGLDKYNIQTGIFKHYNTSNGLSSNVVYGILEDKLNNLWISGLSGLSTLNTSNNKIDNYYYSDGIQANEFNQRSCYKNNNSGEMFFGGINGITSFYPEHIKTSTQKPNIIISSLKLFGETVMPRTKVNKQVILDKEIYNTTVLKLNYLNNNISIGYTALSYANPYGIIYKYILEGFDTKWHTSDSYNREANYSNLPHGTYTFSVIAGDTHDNWSIVPAKIKIIISPPFWKTWWFITLLIVLLILLIIVIIYYRTLSLRKHKIHLEQIVLLRTYELEASNTELEERQEEIYNQKEELHVQKSNLEETNSRLEEQQEEINSQKEELLAQNNHLEEVNSNLEEVNKLLIQHQLEIEKKNLELDEHKNNLEGLVNERTKELNDALLKAEESDRLKSSFLANMSHEIRTPMNAIVGFSTLLSESSIEDINKFIPIIQKNSASLLLLIDDILDLSKIQAGQLLIKQSNEDLNYLLNDVFIYFLYKCQEKNIDFISEFDQEQPLYAYCDSLRVKQILNNLLSNALKYTDSGNIKAGYLKPENGFVTIFVSDTGIGIPSNVGETIFDRFTKIERNTDRLYGGTGLGLAITKSMVNLLGGEIWYKSEENKGTTFYFSLPLANTNTINVTTPQEKPLNYIISSFEGKNALIAEDETSNYLILSSYLKKYNITTHWARNGKEAIELLNSETKFDIVFIDIKMPIMDGFEAVKIIKQLYPKMPVVAQTAFARIEEITKNVEHFDNYITKPIRLVELTRIINLYLK